MKKTIFTTSLLLVTHFFVTAQSLATVATPNNNICNGTKNGLAGTQFNSAMNELNDVSRIEPVNDYDRYMNKSYSRNTVAWFLVGAGTLSTAIGVINLSQVPLISFNSAEQKKNEKKEKFGATIGIIGVAALLGSIPLFISSSMYKRKARLLISNQKTGFGIPHKYGKELTGITLSIPIGK